MSAEHPGFKKSVRNGVIRCKSVKQLALDIAMELGEVSETVEVQADAPLFARTPPTWEPSLADSKF